MNRPCVSISRMLHLKKKKKKIDPVMKWPCDESTRDKLTLRWIDPSWIDPRWLYPRWITPRWIDPAMNLHAMNLSAMNWPCDESTQDESILWWIDPLINLPAMNRPSMNWPKMNWPYAESTCDESIQDESTLLIFDFWFCPIPGWVHMQFYRRLV
jgi:hypothetical protein